MNAPSAAFLARTRKLGLPAATWPIRATTAVTAVHLPTLAELRAWFRPQGREHVQALVDAGEYHPDAEEEAGIWASHLARDAYLDPPRGAAVAVGFLARCVGRIG